MVSGVTINQTAPGVYQVNYTTTVSSVASASVKFGATTAYGSTAAAVATPLVGGGSSCVATVTTALAVFHFQCTATEAVTGLLDASVDFVEPLTDLCQLSDVKAWINLPSTVTTSDALLARLITACSVNIRRWLGYNLNAATYTEAYDGTGTTRLTLRQFPVTAVSSLTVNGQTIPAAANAQTYGYLFDKYGLYMTSVSGTPTSAPSAGYVLGAAYFPRANQNVSVVYTAGYATIPSDIAQACIEYVAFKFQQKSHVGVRSRSLNAGGESVTYQEGMLPAEVAGALWNYRKVAVT